MNHQAPTTPLSPYDESSPVLNGGKKRKAGSSGRGVASLTPDQLAKKRANDREAQRAIRERTKNTIESLERKIQQLESQQPYQELQAVIRQKDAIQAENDEIRRRLASILSIIQPVVGAQGLTDLATAAQHNVQVGFGQPNTNVFQQPDSYMNNGTRHLQGHSPSLNTPNTASYPVPFPTSEHDDVTHDGRAWSAPRDALNQQRDNMQRNLDLNESGERLPFDFLLDNLNSVQSSKMTSVQPPSSRSRPQEHYQIGTSYQGQDQPHYSMIPKNSAPSCVLDHILLDFLRARQSEAAASASGSGPSSYQAPAYPSVSSLLNPTSSRPSNVDPLSQLMTDIIGKFPHISTLPDQLAVLYTMFYVMRWEIQPTAENYERLPDFMTPRPSQLFTEHPAWIDHVPWPRMRDKVIDAFSKDHNAYPFGEWFLPFTSGLTVNWPYEAADCLLSTATNSDNVGDALTSLNPVFERHIRRLENWSLNHQFAVAYPELVETATFREPAGESLAGEKRLPVQGQGRD